MNPIDTSGKIKDYQIHLSLLSDKNRVLAWRIKVLKFTNNFFPFFRLRLANERIERFKTMVDIRAKEEYIDVLMADLNKYAQQKALIVRDMEHNFADLVRRVGNMCEKKPTNFDLQKREYIRRIVENYKTGTYENDDAKITEYLMLRDIAGQVGIQAKPPPPQPTDNGKGNAELKVEK